jgi:hypothetical protein
VGFNDLQGRSAYQPTIHHQGNRWIAYIGHHGGTDAVPKPINPLTGQLELSGTSIVDVTDPAHPVYLRHLPGQEGNYEAGGAQMTRVCDGKDLPKGDPSAVYLLRTFGGSAHEFASQRDIVMIVDESLVNECQEGEARKMVWFVVRRLRRRNQWS